MAISKKQSLLVLLALAVVSSAAMAEFSPLQGLEEEKFFLPPGMISQCWKSVIGIEGCAKDVLTSFLTLNIKLSPECCDAIQGVEEKCFFNIFANPPFNPFFPPLLRGFCTDKAAAGKPSHAPPPS